MKIRSVSAHQIYDSRGDPTIEVEVALDNGTTGRGLVPSGASTGRTEAIELRDGDPSRWRGRSVLRAVEHVRREIGPPLVGWDPADQAGLDRRLIELDGTPDKGRLGANAVLGVSLAAADAAARAQGEPLFAHVRRLFRRPGPAPAVSTGPAPAGAFPAQDDYLLPLPEIQIIGGGAHAGGRLDVQDFLLIAVGAKTYAESLEITYAVYRAAGDMLSERGLRRGVADEGGYWPEFETNEEPIRFLVEAIERAGYEPGRDAALALDIAAGEFYDEPERRYRFRRENRAFDSSEFAALITGWCDRYPIVSIEDPMAETDAEGWRKIAEAVGRRVQLVGDDVFTTHVERIREGIARRIANAVLIKPNQIGTLSETLEAIRVTQAAGWRPVVSARSGETEDAFIAHLAVGTDAGQLKVGSFARSERMAKWNEILRIERALGPAARFAAGPLIR
ncbi:MAG: phosphopyruvate hydratase [Opitutaceae bacterium]